MESFALLLVGASCVTHAAWNLICKRCGTSPTFFLLANASVALCGWPILFAYTGQEIRNLPVQVWICLGLTGLFQAGYFAFLALAYRAGDVSLVYPVARIAPIFVLAAEIVRLQKLPAAVPSLGILLAVAGCFIMSRDRSTKTGCSKAGHRTGRAISWAVATAIASAGYTLVDFIGVRATCQVIPELRGALLYGYLEWVSTTVMLFAVARLADGRGRVRKVWREQRKPIASVAALCYITYTMVLWAFVHADQVAYVAGFRQLSIVLGVAGGVLLLKERAGPIRMAGAATITVGLLLIVIPG